MKKLIYIIGLALPLQVIAQGDMNKDLVANFYRTSAEQIDQANRKFVKEYMQSMFVYNGKYEHIQAIPDSVRYNEIKPADEGFAIYGVMYLNRVKCAGDVAIIGRYTYQSRENRSRVLIEPLYYVSTGGKSDCPLTGTISDFDNCKPCALTMANFRDKYLSNSIDFKKLYKNKVSETLERQEDRW